jgi:hypothetical protein
MYPSHWKLLASVHPKTPTLRTAKAFGYTDEKRNLLIHKPYDDAALCGPAVITAKKLRFWTGTSLCPS